MPKKFLFYMGHPAHFHNISVVIKQLSEKGHKIHLVGRDKDVLFDLVEGLPYSISKLKPRRGSGKIALIWEVVKREFKMLRIVLRSKPDVMIATDIVVPHIGKLLKIPTIILNEDDVNEIPFFTKYGIRYCSVALSPLSCDGGKYQYKTVKYNGYHELAYLHPDHFSPDKSRIQHLFGKQEKYFIIRFSGLTAHHDSGVSGIDKSLALKIIATLSTHGNVFITSERPLDKDLDIYRISVTPQDIHHALYYADMYIGDSQTMCAEAAVLGTPSIRFNDFVGRLGYLEELEHTFGLTFGFKTADESAMLSKIGDLLTSKNLNEKWSKKREFMLSKNLNVAHFWTWFFDNYTALKQEGRGPSDFLDIYNQQ